MPNLNMKKGFTLIELLVTISIIGVLVTITTFGLKGARENARDAKRKADLETIKGTLALYYQDCRTYPSPVVKNGMNSLPDTVIGQTIAGRPDCDPANTYISETPADPQTGTRDYYYSYPYPSGGNGYILCAALENAPNPLGTLTGCPAKCGTEDCNYRTLGS